MNRPAASDSDLQSLREGEAPRSPELLAYLEAPQPGWSEFLRREYLSDYVSHGGTKLKLLVGSKGTGKTHLLRLCADLARREGFLVAELRAFGSRLFPIDRLYGACVRAIGLSTLVDAHAWRAVEHLGFERSDLPPQRSFLDYAVREGLGAEATLRRSLRERVDSLLAEPRLDSTFATGIAQAVGARLGVFHLNTSEWDALTRWFHAEKVSLSELRPLQIYERADRYSARDYLRSLTELARLAGFRGFLLAVDEMETVAHRSPVTGSQRYTRTQRDEAYETIRQLMDDVDRTRSTLYLLAGRREFLEDEKAGISSYEALRLRLLNEVRAARFNPYADIVDLDAMRATGYLSRECLVDWYGRLCECASEGLAEEAPPLQHFSLRELARMAAAGAAG